MLWEPQTGGRETPAEWAIWEPVSCLSCPQLWKSYSERLQDAQTVAHWPTASCLDPDSFLELGSQIRLRERRETQGEEEEEEEDGIQMGVGEGSCSREGPS